MYIYLHLRLYDPKNGKGRQGFFMNTVAFIDCFKPHELMLSFLLCRTQISSAFLPDNEKKPVPVPCESGITAVKN